MTGGHGQKGEPDEGEFQRAIGRSSNAWYRACVRITRDDAMARDAVQDALLQAWARRGQFRGGARLDTWIHRIAVNCALGLLRKRRPDGGLDTDTIASDSPSPLAAVLDHQLGDELARALHELSDMERLCFVLKHLEQWTLKEIAAELDTAVGSVKQALFRALGKLRSSMAPMRRQA